MKKEIIKAKVVIIEKGKVLLLKRIDREKRLSFAGGIVKSNESHKEGLIREIKEELGVKVSKQDLEYIFSFKKKKAKVKITTRYYRLKTTNKKFKINEPNKFNLLKWFNIKYAISNVTKKQGFILKQQLNLHKNAS
ncbi:NUDIX hydrolase [uncultured Winogradskyella sp.]|uniref:NUDIX hydrolase n=1 Tax=uncultured Winogradskyella sp. TaxID=395353 RepID=UPI002625D417|nr:NUDIX hydrolase [uncultured Winogradskyella sp.]